MPTFYGENRTSRFAFYELQLKEGGTHVMIRWGKIGTEGQAKLIKCWGPEVAETFFERKRREKISRGYKTLTPSKPKTLPQAVQVIEMHGQTEKVTGVQPLDTAAQDFWWDL